MPRKKQDPETPPARPKRRATKKRGKPVRKSVPVLPDVAAIAKAVTSQPERAPRQAHKVEAPAGQGVRAIYDAVRALDAERTTEFWRKLSIRRDDEDMFHVAMFLPSGRADLGVVVAHDDLAAVAQDIYERAQSASAPTSAAVVVDTEGYQDVRIPLAGGGWTVERRKVRAAPPSRSRVEDLETEREYLGKQPVVTVIADEDTPVTFGTVTYLLRRGVPTEVPQTIASIYQESVRETHKAKTQGAGVRCAECNRDVRDCRCQPWRMGAQPVMHGVSG